MKLKKLLTKTLLVVAMLGVGVNGAWATATQTLFSQNYQEATSVDWTCPNNGGGLSLVTSGSNKYLQYSGTNENTRGMYLYANNSDTYGVASLDNYTIKCDFYIGAFPNNGSNTFQLVFLGNGSSYSGTGNTYNNGINTSNPVYLYIQENAVSSGACTIYVNDANSAVGSLTFETGKWYTITQVITKNASDNTKRDIVTTITDNSGNSIIKSVDGTSAKDNIETTAVSVATLGYFKGYYIRSGKNWEVFGVDNLAITTEVDEEVVSNPVIGAPVYAAENRTITITNGESSDDNTVTTYYTTDGTEPTSSNYAGSFTTASKEVTITSSCTVKAIAVSSTGVTSFIVSRNITAGKLTLNAPTVIPSSFALSGSVYWATYTFSSDQSSLDYTPGDLTYTYSFNGGDATEASSYAATGTGTLRVTVSTDDYTSSYTDIDVTSYTSTYYLNIYKSIAEPLGNGGGGGSSTTINGTGCDYNTLAAAVLNGLTITGDMDHAWAKTDNYSHSIYKRGNGTGYVTYNGSFPAGSYMYCFKAEGNGYYVFSSNTANFPKYSGFRDLRVLVPSASAEAYALASGTNLTNNGAFTSNVTGWDTKGTITKESDSSTSGSGFGWNSNGWAEMWASNDSGSDDYAHYNSDCYIAQRYVNMPAGDYYVSADLVANGGNVSVYTISVNGVVQETDNGDFENWTTKAHVINVPSDNSLITIKYAPQNGGRAWVGIDNVSCVYDPNPSVTVSAAGYATYVNSDYNLDFSETAIKAYKVKVNKKGVATMTKVDAVPAGTPVLLYAEGGETEDIPVTTGAAAVIDNDLVAGTSTTASEGVPTIDGDYTNMILNNIDSKIGFYFANNQKVATNRAYLHIDTDLAPDAVEGSRMVMVFADETTGIQVVNSEGLTVNGFYNLSGQRVNQPTKGLYIVNGKKVIMK